MALLIVNPQVDLGDEVMEYVPPFSFKIDETTGTLVEDGEPIHPILTLVYKQPGRISMTKRQNGCNTNIVGNRLGFQGELAAEYGLEGPIAGNFLHTVYDKSTDSILCRLTRCTGASFPAPLAGVNDGPMCQA